MPKRVQRSESQTIGQIHVADPFSLIRHLARSQSDPRKAVAELVQNALDEQATRISIERRREQGEVVLSIRDDGIGVLPDLPRRDALETIARNIGKSRKRQLSFDERLRAAMLGQYGIGILGFWAIGHEFKMISRVAGSETWCLTLIEDSERFSVEQLATEIGSPQTYTEVQVRRLHRGAMSATVGTRLAQYLAVELRGQLVRHGTEVTLHDALARNPHDRSIKVKPTELAGEKLEGLPPIRVEGYSQPIELQLHYVGDAEGAQVKLACSGAIVLDQLGEHPDYARPPWTDPRLAGFIDFPHLEVPPGSRRGFLPNEASQRLLDALRDVEPVVAKKLDEKQATDAARLSADVHKQLAKLFSRATDYVPHLDWLPVARSATSEEPGAPAGAPVNAARPDDSEGKDPQPSLFPPGPLAEVKLSPAKQVVLPGSLALFRARATDAHGVTVQSGVTYAAECAGGAAIEAVEGGRVQVRAGNEPGTATLIVRATEGDAAATAQARLDVVAELPPKRNAGGIPAPAEVDDPQGNWRSRTSGTEWQVNIGHPDYKDLSAEPRRRLRYLAHLLAKEVIAKNFPEPGVAKVLEELVGLLAALERSGAWGPGRL